MKKTRTRLWSLLLTVAMLLTLLPTTALAEGETCDGGDDCKHVAAIENTHYDSLQEAVTAAGTTKSTITLLRDASGNGVKVPSNRNIIFDFAGWTYNIDGTTVGSTGTETNGFQLLKDSTIEFRNGTLTSTKAIILIQNYSNLTLSDMNLDGSETNNYVLSNNFGNINITGNTSITAALGKTAFDVYYWPAGGYGDGVSVTVDTTGTITGKIEYSSDGTTTGKANVAEKATLVIKQGTIDGEISTKNLSSAGTTGISITGGTFSSDVSKYIAPGYVCTPSGESYIVEPLGRENATAMVTGDSGVTYFETLKEAITAAKGGETVELLKDVTEDVTIPENADITLDLGTYTLTNKSSHTIVNNGTLTIIGSGTVDNVTHAKAALYNAPGATVVLNGGTYTRSEENGISSTDNGGNSFYTIQNQGTMTINDGVTVNQGGDGNGKYSSLVANGWYNGSQNTQKENAIMTINGGVFNGGINTIKNDDWGIMEIYDGTIQNSAQHALMNANKGTIYGGTFISDSTRGAVYAYAQYDNIYGLGELTIKGGEFTSNGTAAIEAGALSAISITGGTFSSDPSTYVAQGYKALEENGIYRVGKPITVSFVNEGTMVKTVEVLSGDTVSAPADPVKEGCVFQGWYNGDTKFNASSPVTESGTYTAKWEIETYTVTFDANGGSEVESQQVAYGGSATEPTTIKEGYAFAGWYLNEELYDFTASVTENIVLTAKWNEVVTPDDQPAGVDQIQVAPNTPVIEDSSVPGAEEVIKALEEGVEQEGVTEAAKALATDSAYMAEIAAEAKTELELGDDKNVTLVVETSLNISVTDVKDGDSFTLDITPTYSITAIAEGQEPVEIVTNQELPVNRAVTLTIPLPKSFVDAAELFVHHLKNGRTYVYDGKVLNGKLSFLNPHGFSQFTISKVGAAASVGSTSYATLQDAIDAVENGGTVTVHQSGLYAQVSGVKTFWVETDAGVDMPLLFAGPGYTLSRDGSKFTVRVRTIDDPDDDYELPTWDITVEDSDNGDVEVSPEEAKPTTTITITVTPDKGYAVAEVVVTAENGKEITVTDKGNGKYTFSMPNSDVTIEVTFQPVSGGAAGSDLTITAPTGWVNPFTDVAANAWYYDAVGYANANGLMGGTSATTFAPNGAMNRSMVWTVIARLAGQTISGANWAEDAKAWAVAQGVSDGTNPDGNVTREELVTMLYRYIGSPVMNVPELGLINSYPDAASVSDWAQDAFAWALSRGIIDGRDGKLASGESVTRAEAATILARFHLLTK